MAAWVAGDRSALEEILAPEFALIVSGRPRELFPRDAWLQAALGGYTATAFRYRDMQVRVFTDVAVVSSIGEQQATAFGQDRSGTFFLTDVWCRRNGTWQVIARYSSHPEPASSAASLDAAAGYVSD